MNKFIKLVPSFGEFTKLNEAFDENKINSGYNDKYEIDITELPKNVKSNIIELWAEYSHISTKEAEKDLVRNPDGAYTFYFDNKNYFIYDEISDNLYKFDKNGEEVA